MSMSWDHVCRTCGKKFSSWDGVPLCNDCETPERKQKYFELAGEEDRLFQSLNEHLNPATQCPWSYLTKSELLLIELRNILTRKRIDKLQTTKIK